ncbi:MAG: PEP-CTERM sorting domain-containing protein [Phycisphaerales bacterium]|nr:MAG: PEP-CTERM sorting domain-containing protein [Phycisphaerales bacterium]
MQRCILNGMFVVGLVVLCANPVAAQDDAIVSFAYSDLNGAFGPNGMSWVFEAADDFDSDGDVTRLVDPRGSDALFAGTGTAADGGFAGDAAFSLFMPIEVVGMDFVTNGGTITLTDVDGDSFSGTVSGIWTKTEVVASAAFAGAITNVEVATPGDGMFEGTNGGMFSLDFPSDPPFEGSLITLAFGKWFFNDLGPQTFEDANVSVGGAIVPEPLTLSLLLVGGLVATRRKGR